MTISNCVCGYNISDELVLIDSLYPMNRERTKWILVCQVHNGGCGREVVSGDYERVIERWNNGEIDNVDGVVIIGE